MANVKFSKEELETAADDVSQIFETPIPTGVKTTIKKLKNDLIEAATELQADDEITDKTIEILTSLGARLPDPEEKPDLDLDKDEKDKDEKDKDEKDKDKSKKKISNSPKKTKKSIIINILRSKSGGTIEEMAKACVKADLGDLAQNMRTCKLWLHKIGFAIEKKNDIFKAK